MTSRSDPIPAPARHLDLAATLSFPDDAARLSKHIKLHEGSSELRISAMKAIPIPNAPAEWEEEEELRPFYFWMFLILFYFLTTPFRRYLV